MSRRDPVEIIGQVRLYAPTPGCVGYRLRWTEPDGSPGDTTAGRDPAAAIAKAAALDRRLARAAGPAVRLLDHVAQVRTQAWTALRPLLDLSTAAPILDVLLAGRDRQRGPRALDDVTTQLSAVAPDAAPMTALASEGPRAVRRWAFETGHARGLLSTAQLVKAAREDPDQWVQANCAEWLMSEPDVSQLVPCSMRPQ